MLHREHHTSRRPPTRDATVTTASQSNLLCSQNSYMLCTFQSRNTDVWKGDTIVLTIIAVGTKLWRLLGITLHASPRSIVISIIDNTSTQVLKAGAICFAFLCFFVFLHFLCFYVFYVFVFLVFCVFSLFCFFVLIYYNSWRPSVFLFLYFCTFCAFYIFFIFVFLYFSVLYFWTFVLF